jgi:hypothetical protein
MRRHEVDEGAEFFRDLAGSMSTWARYHPVDGAEPDDEHMADGDGARFRAATKAGAYRCMLADCDGWLWVKAGSYNRHHWAHRMAPVPAHAPESVWHVNAKAALARFVRTSYVAAQVFVDERYTPAGNNPAYGRSALASTLPSKPNSPSSTHPSSPAAAPDTAPTPLRRFGCSLTSTLQRRGRLPRMRNRCRRCFGCERNTVPSPTSGYLFAG